MLPAITPSDSRQIKKSYLQPAALYESGKLFPVFNGIAMKAQTLSDQRRQTSWFTINGGRNCTHSPDSVVDLRRIKVFGVSAGCR